MPNPQAGRPTAAPKIARHHHPPPVTDADRELVRKAGKLTFKPVGKNYRCNQTGAKMKQSQLSPYRKQFDPPKRSLNIVKVKKEMESPRGQLKIKPWNGKCPKCGAGGILSYETRCYVCGTSF